MSSVFFDPGVGGDGSTVTDDVSPQTGLANGGHRNRFVPALSNLVAICRTAINAATAAATSLNSATYAGTGTSVVALGLGNRAITTQAGKGWFVGQWLQLIAGNNAWMVGQVARYSGSTLEINVSSYGGSGTHAAWTIVPGTPWNADRAQFDWPFHRLTLNQFGNPNGEGLMHWQTYKTKVKVTVKRDIITGIAWSARDEEERTILNAMGMNLAVHFSPNIRVLRISWQKEAGTDSPLLPFQVMPVRQVVTMASYARLVSGAIAAGPNGMYLAGITQEWGLCGRQFEPSTGGDYLHIHPFCASDTGEVEVILPGAVAGRFPLDRANPRWGWFDHRSALNNLDTSL